MIFGLEWNKVKRTGFLPAFIAGSLLSAAVPIVDMAVRSDMYTQLKGTPIQILMNADWQLMAMLNVLLCIAGACLMYHTEYADNGIQKMCTLPIKEHHLFFCKFALITVMCAVVFTLEAAGITFCSINWFKISSDFWFELLKSFGYAFMLMLPSILSSLLIASLCKNMWVSLGIGVICVFLATMLPMNHFTLSVFPFALPFRIFSGTAESTIRNYLIASACETALIATIEIILLKVRRWTE